jgi:hypothetical protein
MDQCIRTANTKIADYESRFILTVDWCHFEKRGRGESGGGD